MPARNPVSALRTAPPRTPPPQVTGDILGRTRGSRAGERHRLSPEPDASAQSEMWPLYKFRSILILEPRKVNLDSVMLLLLPDPPRPHTALLKRAAVLLRQFSPPRGRPTSASASLSRSFIHCSSLRTPFLPPRTRETQRLKTETTVALNQAVLRKCDPCSSSVKRSPEGTVQQEKEPNRERTHPVVQ